MPDGDGSERPKAVEWVIPLVGILLALGIALMIGYLSGYQNDRHDNAARAYKYYAKENAKRACIGREPAAVFECVNEHAEAANQAAYNEQNLETAQWTGWAALGAAIVALLTLGVSGVGVWYVKRTLDATLEAVEDTGLATKAMVEANNITKQIADFELRPWLTITKIEHQLSHVLEREIIVWFEVTVHNYGKSPAVGIEIETFFIVINDKRMILDRPQFYARGDRWLADGFQFRREGRVSVPDREIIMHIPVRITRDQWASAAQLSEARLRFFGEFIVRYCWGTGRGAFFAAEHFIHNEVDGKIVSFEHDPNLFNNRKITLGTPHVRERVSDVG